MSLYRVAIQDNFSFQSPVISKTSIPPTSKNKGDRYLITATASGDWTGKETQLTYYDGSAWQYIIPTSGFLFCVNSEKIFYQFNGTTWEPVFSNQPSSSSNLLKNGDFEKWVIRS